RGIPAGDADRVAQRGNELSVELVRKYLSDEDARTLLSDPPLIRARKTAQAAASVLKSVRWPNLVVAFWHSPEANLEHDQWGQAFCRMTLGPDGKPCEEWDQHKDLRWRGGVIQEGFGHSLTKAAALAEAVQEGRAVPSI